MVGKKTKAISKKKRKKKQHITKIANSPPRIDNTNLKQISRDTTPSKQKRKLEVFVGSTFKGMQIYRRAIIDAILEAGHIPSGMELWESGSIPLLNTIKEKLDQCDVHILLVGNEYGSYIREDTSAEDADRISFTEWEFLQSNGVRPVIAFIADTTANADSQKKEEEEKQKQLKKFKKLVQDARFCRQYSGPIDMNPESQKAEAKQDATMIAEAQQLSRHVTNSLHQFENVELASLGRGWIRADSIEAIQAEAIRGNRFLARIMDRLQKFSVLTERVLDGALEKEMAATVFWQSLTGPIRRAGMRNIFFESGSTIAFVSEAFERDVLSKSAPNEKWQVWTNNVETLLHLELYSNAKVVSFPSEAPILGDKYGAIFSRTFLGVFEKPPISPRSLYSKDDYTNNSDCNTEKSLVEQTQQKLARELGERAIVCVTASGLDNNKIEEKKWQKGPHIGSHENMLFKRAVYTTGCPTVLFLHWEKIKTKPFKLGSCYPVFLDDYPWDNFIEKHPVALCIGYRTPSDNPVPKSPNITPDSQADWREVEEFCRDLGFTYRLEHVVNKKTKVGAAVFANKLFCNKFKV